MKYQGGFRKKNSSQYSLLAIFEKCKEVLDNGGSCGALLENISQNFGCIVFDLLLAKPGAYCFKYKSVN